MNPIMIVLKTYKFLLLRLVIAATFLLPALYAPRWGLNLYVGIFGRTTWALELIAIYVATVSVYFVLKKLSTYVLHLVQFIHTASMTLLIKNNGDGRASGIFKSLALTGSRLGSTVLLMVIDNVLTDSCRKLIEWWTSLDKLPKLMKTGLLFHLFKKSVENIVLNISETVVSYLFYNTDEKLFKGISKSLLLIVKSGKEIIRNSIIVTIGVTVVIFLLDVTALIYSIVHKWNEGIFVIVYFYFILKIIIHLVKIAVVEPILTASILSAFYERFKQVEISEEEADSLTDKMPKFETHLLNKDKRKQAIESLTTAIVELVPDDMKNIVDKIPIINKKGEQQNG